MNNSNYKTPYNFKDLFKDLYPLIKKRKKYLLITFIASIFYMLLGVMAPKMLGDTATYIFSGIIGEATGAGSGMEVIFLNIGKMCLTLLLLYFLIEVFKYINDYLMARTTTLIICDLRESISTKINRIDLSYIRETGKGDLLSIVTNDINKLDSSISIALTGIYSSVVTFLGISVAMFLLNWVVALAVFTLIPLAVLIDYFLIKHTKSYAVSMSNSLGRLNDVVEESFSQHELVQVFNYKSKIRDKFTDVNDKMYKPNWKSSFYSDLIQPVVSLSLNSCYVIICILGAQLVSMGSMQIGGILTFVQYAKSLVSPLSTMSNIYKKFPDMLASSQRIFRFLHQPQESSEKGLTQISEDEKMALSRKNIEFDKVNFAYVENKPVIEDFSAELLSKSKIGIVGETGSGKSTVMKLLMRLYERDSGSISLSEKDINNIKRDEVREMFGMILQEAWLFNGTFRENLKYGRMQATDEEMIEAAKLAQIHDYIMSLPDQYDTMVDEDASNISKGQKQLITIARVILAKPRMIIWDEATSSIDTQTEELINKAMESLMKAKTNIIIAHRLNTIKDADKILVLKNGKLIEEGNHEELLMHNGYYAEMYKSQFAE
jgi:ATP-binding cassette subfamily B protein